MRKSILGLVFVTMCTYLSCSTSSAASEDNVVITASSAEQARPFFLTHISLSVVALWGEQEYQEMLLMFLFPPGWSTQIISYALSEDNMSMVVELRNGDVPERFPHQHKEPFTSIVSSITVDPKLDTITVRFNRPVMSYKTYKVTEGVIGFSYFAAPTAKRSL